MKTQDNSCFAQTITLHHASGDILIPVKVRNRKTGCTAFRIAEPVSGSNKNENQVETLCEGRVARALADGWLVRCATRSRSRNGMYGAAKNSIRKVARNGGCL